MRARTAAASYLFVPLRGGPSRTTGSGDTDPNSLISLRVRKRPESERLPEGRKYAITASHDTLISKSLSAGCCLACLSNACCPTKITWAGGPPLASARHATNLRHMHWGARRAVTWCPPMTSIYDLFAHDCAKIAAKTKNKSDKAHLLRLAKQWQMVATEQDGEIGKSALFPVPALKAPERR
jgi:hypothetical protein